MPRITRNLKRIAKPTVFVAVFSSLILFAWILWKTYQADNLGFSSKTLWDWLDLLIVPAVLALAAVWLNYTQKNTELKVAKEAREIEQKIAENRQQQATLEAYYDSMTDLLLMHKLREKSEEENAEERSIARARTLAVLRSLDSERTAQVVKFLYESGLIEEAKPIVYLDNANLQGAYLQGANLGGAHLAGANLQVANLQGAYLGSVHLASASLQGAILQESFLFNANFRKAHLEEANLKGVNLEEANLEEANLQRARLQGADLMWADLTKANLQGTTYSIKTIWPNGFDPQAAGAVLQKYD